MSSEGSNGMPGWLAIAAITLCLMATASAYTMDDYLQLDKVEVGWNDGCAYYTAMNPSLDRLDVKDNNMLSVKEWKHVKGAASNERWEILTTSVATKSEWVSAWECHESVRKNDTVEECTDNGYYKSVDEYSKEWKPLAGSLDMMPLGRYSVRMCADIERDMTTAIISDHIPSFMGYDYAKYAWFNSTFGYSYDVNCTNPYPYQIDYPTCRVTLNASSNFDFNYSWTDLNGTIVVCTNVTDSSTYEAPHVARIIDPVGISVIDFSPGYIPASTTLGCKLYTNETTPYNRSSWIDAYPVMAGADGSFSEDNTTWTYTGSGLDTNDGDLTFTGIARNVDVRVQKAVTLLAENWTLEMWQDATSYGASSAWCIGAAADAAANCQTYEGSGDNMLLMFDPTGNMNYYRIHDNAAGLLQNFSAPYDGADRWYVFKRYGTKNNMSTYTDSLLTSQSLYLEYLGQAITGLNTLTVFSSKNSGHAPTVTGNIDDVRLMNYEPIMVSPANLEAQPAAPSLDINVTFGNASYETQNLTAMINLSAGSTGNILDFNMSFHFNNTEIYALAVTGITQKEYLINTSMVLPLVASGTAMRYDVYANATVNLLATTSQVNETSDGNITVLEHYTESSYPVSGTANMTVEERTNYTMEYPAVFGTANVSLDSYSYLLDYCVDTWARAASNWTNTTICYAGLATSSPNYFEIRPSHYQLSGSAGGSDGRLVRTDYHMNRSYTISFSLTPESTSTKTILANGSLMKQDHYIWLVDENNGTSNPITSAAPHTFLDHEFYDEVITTNSLNITVGYAALEVRTPDGTEKIYNVTYTNLSYAWLKMYPNNLDGNIKFFGFEEFQKAGYGTRRRIYAEHMTLSSEYSETNYLLDAYTPGAASILLTVSGYPTAHYVKVYKKEGFNYNRLDDRYLTATYQAYAFLIMDGYYKMEAYDSEGNLLASEDDMQVDCSLSCRLALGDVGGNVTDYDMLDYNVGCYYNITYSQYNSTFGDLQPVSGNIYCLITENPTNSTFNMEMLVNNVTFCNWSGTEYLICDVNVTEVNIFSVTVNLGGVEYVVVQGSYNAPLGTVFNNDASIIWVLGTIAMMTFLWHNIIVASVILFVSFGVGYSLQIIPLGVGVVGMLIGVAMFAIGLFKRSS